MAFRQDRVVVVHAVAAREHRGVVHRRSEGAVVVHGGARHVEASHPLEPQVEVPAVVVLVQVDPALEVVVLVAEALDPVAHRLVVVHVEVALLAVVHVHLAHRAVHVEVDLYFRHRETEVKSAMDIRISQRDEKSAATQK